MVVRIKRRDSCWTKKHNTVLWIFNRKFLVWSRHLKNWKLQRGQRSACSSFVYFSCRISAASYLQTGCAAEPPLGRGTTDQLCSFRKCSMLYIVESFSVSWSLLPEEEMRTASCHLPAKSASFSGNPACVFKNCGHFPVSFYI